MVVRRLGFSGLGNPLFAVDRPTLPWRRCQAGIGGDLPAVLKMTKQHEERIPLTPHGLDLLKKQLEPVELAADLSLRVGR
jgi:hypothetical protein